MTLTLATAFAAFSLLVTLAIALPTTRSSASETTLTVTQTRGSVINTDEPAPLGSCIRVKNSKVPTTLEIQSLSSSSSYQLIGYSSSRCEDDNVVDPPLSVAAAAEGNGIASLQINARRPICSYALGKTPFSHPEPHPVTVKFSYAEGIAPRSEAVGNTSCHDICGEGSSWVSRFPQIVELLEADQVTVANNYVKLYSGSGCEDGSEIQSSRNMVEIYNGVELQTLTQLQGPAIKSFIIATR